MALLIESVGTDSPLFQQVLRLARDNSKTLGFLPKGAFEEYAQSGNLTLRVRWRQPWSGEAIASAS